MIIIYIYACVEAIKPRQIIIHDAGIVLIDLHQQRKNNFQTDTNQRHWIQGNLINEEQNPQNNNPQHPLSNQMIEQINVALEQKGSGISQPEWWSHRQANVEKRAYTSIKSDDEHPAFFLERDDVVNSLNYEDAAGNWLRFYHFPDSDRLRVGSVSD